MRREGGWFDGLVDVEEDFGVLVDGWAQFEGLFCITDKRGDRIEDGLKLARSRKALVIDADMKPVQENVKDCVMIFMCDIRDLGEFSQPLDEQQIRQAGGIFLKLAMKQITVRIENDRSVTGCRNERTEDLISETAGWHLRGH